MRSKNERRHSNAQPEVDSPYADGGAEEDDEEVRFKLAENSEQERLSCAAAVEGEKATLLGLLGAASSVPVADSLGTASKRSTS